MKKKENNQLSYSYRDIIITYNERFNNWQFMLRGWERTAESLQKAKDIIDRPVKQKKKPFKKIPAYCSPGYGGNGSIIECEVTSFFDDYRGAMARVSYEEKSKWGGTSHQRDTVLLKFVYPRNEKNNKILAQIRRCEAEIKLLEKEQALYRKRMQTIKAPRQEELEDDATSDTKQG